MNEIKKNGRLLFKNKMVIQIKWDERNNWSWTKRPHNETVNLGRPNSRV